MDDLTEKWQGLKKEAEAEELASQARRFAWRLSTLLVSVTLASTAWGWRGGVSAGLVLWMLWRGL